MIGALNGKILERRGEQVTLDVNGVGYDVTLTAAALSSISKENTLRITVYTDVKESSISLFGFRNSLEKEVFLMLRKVKGIGSKIALSIVSSVGAEGVLRTIGQNDIARLKSIPGIGGKTAERIIVELRESVTQFAQEIVAEGTPVAEAALRERIVVEKGAEGDVILALEKLGFPLERARQVVAQTIAANPSVANIKTDAGELLRLALGNIG